MRKLLLASVALASIATPELALAQSAAPAANETDAIIVTARRREEDVSKVPIAITAFSGATLEKKNVVNLADVVKIAPGINITVGGTRTSPFITIRGQSRAITGNIQPGVITYVNEVPLVFNGSLIPTYDVANIQVVKGPQGTLFGRNSMGGAVLVETKRPNYNFGGYAKVEMASHDYRMAEGMVNLPILADKVALRLAAQVYDDGGSTSGLLVDPYTVPLANAAGVTPPIAGTIVPIPGAIRPLGRNLDKMSGRSVRGSLLIEPMDGIKNTTIVEYSKVRGLTASVANGYFANGYTTIFQGVVAASQLASSPALQYRAAAVLNTLGQGGTNVYALARCGDINGGSQTLNCDWRAAQAYTNANNGRSAVANADPYLSRTILFNIVNNTEVSIGNATLKNIFGYRSTDVYSNTDIDGSGLFVTQTSSQYRIGQISDELQLSGSLLNNLVKYTVGGFYFSEKPNGTGGSGATEVNALFGFSHNLSGQYLHNKSKAVYGQFDISLDPVIPGLTVTAGARQTWDSTSVCAYNIRFSGLGNAIYVTGPHSSFIPTEAQCRSSGISATTLGVTARELAAETPILKNIFSQTLPERKSNKFTYTLGANWQVTPDAMIYFTHRRGYRSGGYTVPVITDPYVAQLQTFTPETLTDFEVGAKVRWNAGSVRGTFEVSAFTGKDKNHQSGYSSSSFNGGICVAPALGTPGHPGTAGADACTTGSRLPAAIASKPGSTVVLPSLTTVLNDGDLTLRGFEVAATLSPFAGVTVGGGLAYVDSKIDRISIDPRFQDLFTYNGTSVPPFLVQQQPSWAYNAFLDLALPGKVLSSDVSFNANFKHTDAIVQSEAVVPGYNVVDARLTFGNIGGSNVDLAFYVKNLTNEYYFNGTTASTYSTGMSAFSVAPPRTFGLSAKYSFGG